MKKVSLRHILLLIAVALIIALTVVLRNPRYFPITTVKIQGDYRHIEPSILKKVITPYAEQGFFAISALALRTKLGALPWVKSANIRRQWPNVLIITLAENIPIAIWNNQSLLLDNGDVFTPNALLYSQELPLLSGPTRQQKLVIGSYHKFNQILKPLQLSVQQLSLSERHAWRLVLSNHTIVVLGQKDIAGRLQRFVNIYPSIMAKRAKKNLLSVDLRYPNGVAARWN